MENNNWENYLRIMKKEIVPALGCTEPVAVALAAAKAKQLVKGGTKLQSLEVYVSRNILKNAMSVGIPGTKFFGLEYAAVLGVFGGNAEAGLEVLKDIKEEHVTATKAYIDQQGVKIQVKPVDDTIYIEVVLHMDGYEARTVICGEHTNVTLLELDHEIVYKGEIGGGCSEDGCQEFSLSDATLRDIYEFVTSVPLERLEFILEAIKLNSAVSREGLKNEYGLQVGKKMKEKMELGLLSEDLCNLAVMRCAGAIDARMAGCTLPAMTNSGSGNQGITATLPVLTAAQRFGAAREKTIRAVALSHIVSIYIKSHMDRLSAQCGAIVAASGACCGITYLSGGEFDQIAIALKNIIANISGMICDGAKSSCSLKVSSSVHAAFFSSMLAMEGMCVKDIEGIVEGEVDKTIDNLGKLASVGMKTTDSVILDIMVSK